MEKLRLSRIMVRAETVTICQLARLIEERNTVTVLKEPAKTLVMLPMREPVRGMSFYIGEMLASEALVEVGDAKGVGICMSDDTGRALAMAVIDAAYNAGLPECLWLTQKLQAIELAQHLAIGKEAALHRSTTVSFDTLEGH